MDRTLYLPTALWPVLDRIATDKGVTVDQIFRDAIDRDLRRHTAAKAAVRADERLIAPSRAL